MKKMIAILLASLLLAIPALGELPIDGLPFPDTHAPSAQEAIEIEINGEALTLDFDESPQYSSVEDGLVQVSFYKYSDDGNQLWELYIAFPETAQPGEEIDPGSAIASGEEGSVVLIISDLAAEQEEYYFTSVMSGEIYPEESDYSIVLDDIYEIDGKTTYSGALSATLVALDMANGEVKDTLSIQSAPFRFTLGDGDSARHSDPRPTALPDDMKKV